MKTRWLAIGLMGLLTIMGVVYLSPRPAPEAQTVTVEGAAVVETAVAPAAALTVAPGRVVTPQEVAAAEASLGPAPQAGVVKPFLPTLGADEYRAAKAAAATLAPSSGGRPGVSAANGPLGPPTLLLTNIEGVNQTTAGGLRPPDTHGAIGLTQFVEITNTNLNVYNKLSPFALTRNQRLSSFFGYTAQTIFDPRVLYDKTWNRWVIYAEAFKESATVQRIFLGISTTSSATGSFCIYHVDVNIFNNADFWDYGQLGMDQDSIILTANIFNPGFAGARMFSIAKAQLYNCRGFSVPVFSGLVGTLAPPVVLDQNSRTYLMAAPPSGTSIRKYTLTNSSRPNATALSFVNILVPVYGVPPDARQPGTTNRLDTLDSRFVNASTQIGERLFQVHTVNLSGFPTPLFYEFNTLGAGSVVQRGFFFKDGDSDDWNASIAANTSRDVFVTWSATDLTPATNAQVRFSGRRNFDAANVIGAGSAIFTSPAFYNPSADTVERWGDYSAVTVDPSNALRAWFVNEKINSATVWGTRIGQVGY